MRKKRSREDKGREEKGNEKSKKEKKNAKRKDRKIYIHVYTHTRIYIQRERGGERKRKDVDPGVDAGSSVY